MMAQGGWQDMTNWQDILWKLLPVLTSFGVLVVGAWLTHGARRREWIADNQKEEYRGLLRALNRLNMAVSEEQVQGKTSQDLHQLLREASDAANTSLFIHEFLKYTNVLGQIVATFQKLEQGGKFEDYQREYWEAVNQIVDSATKIKT
jgi:hypothetical protein